MRGRRRPRHKRVRPSALPQREGRRSSTTHAAVGASPERGPTVVPHAEGRPPLKKRTARPSASSSRACRERERADSQTVVPPLRVVPDVAPHVVPHVVLHAVPHVVGCQRPCGREAVGRSSSTYAAETADGRPPRTVVPVARAPTIVPRVGAHPKAPTRTRPSASSSRGHAAVSASPARVPAVDHHNACCRWRPRRESAFPTLAPPPQERRRSSATHHAAVGVAITCGRRTSPMSAEGGRARTVHSVHSPLVLFCAGGNVQQHGVGAAARGRWRPHAALRRLPAWSKLEPKASTGMPIRSSHRAGGVPARRRARWRREGRWSGRAGNWRASLLRGDGVVTDFAAMRKEEGRHEP